MMYKIKTSVFIWILGFIFVSITRAQDYTPINFSDAVWIEYYSAPEGEFAVSQKYCEGDSIIEDEVYNKLYEYKVFSLPPGYTNQTEGPTLLGLIRNSSDKKVLFIPAGSFIPDTIYDFNIELGDSIKGIYHGFVIREIDSVEVCGEFRTRYSESEGSWFLENTLIEGKGFSTGLLGYYDHFDYKVEIMRFIECFFEKSNPNCPNCELIYTSNEQAHLFRCYPNPFTEKLMIQSDLPIYMISITDLTGNKVLTRKFTNKAQVELDLGFLNTGIYHLSVQYENHSDYSTKIIKL
jgi:hypothetical protein